ncbi:hypothetical protein A0H81_12102 [Grifola frondosa]|uniref:Uncharacterized protein n=1 Tax=Grifola frondosa TaxID=5627 RepID=A0A1C7LVE6_GRIFR|nr:hypothetical protein A0H81_12102 [Grifola frondosa]
MKVEHDERILATLQPVDGSYRSALDASKGAHLMGTDQSTSAAPPPSSLPPRHLHQAAIFSALFAQVLRYLDGRAWPGQAFDILPPSSSPPYSSFPLDGCHRHQKEVEALRQERELLMMREVKQFEEIQKLYATIEEVSHAVAAMETAKARSTTFFPTDKYIDPAREDEDYLYQMKMARMAKYDARGAVVHEWCISDESTSSTLTEATVVNHDDVSCGQWVVTNVGRQVEEQSSLISAYSYTVSPRRVRSRRSVHKTTHRLFTDCSQSFCTSIDECHPSDRSSLVGILHP